MTYAQFYQPGALTGKTIEACGDRAVVIYDGRASLASIRRDAATECSRRGFTAWCLCKGETFTRSRPITPIYNTSTTPL